MEDTLILKINKNQEITNLKYVKFYQENNQNIAVLIDSKGFEITKGYGSSLIDAINDLHHNLV
ncbi:hypothetical protein [Psychroserpens damuponensis]|uniref:hypothetical protein n=1 Tax=Psychroserpens damuponensis TaxID=943936 RepID=UPI00058B23B4|nr:hypothetical protein [Psychroserpens damuponensis]